MDLAYTFKQNNKGKDRSTCNPKEEDNLSHQVSVNLTLGLHSTQLM